MSWIFIAAYIGFHFFAYVLVFRRWPFFWTERGIFLFHFFPAISLLALMVINFLTNQTQENFALIVGAGAAHGTYSLSFLECWALSEGGYSLRVLSELVRRGSATPLELEEHFIDVSERKKKGRLESLVDLHLVRFDADRYYLTSLGSVLANAMGLIAKFASPRVSS